MISFNVKSFVILNIYVLIIVDLALLIAIYFKIIKDKIKTKRYYKASIYLTPKVLNFIETEDNLSEIENLVKQDFFKTVIIDIMVDYTEKNSTDISELFIKLRLDTCLIKKLHRVTNISNLRKLAFMRVDTAYDTLLELAVSDKLDISFMSFLGLALINLPKNKKETAIKRLISSNIVSDRIVEILSKFNLNFEEWLELLEKEQTTVGKIVFIKNIMVKQEIQNINNSDKILTFLKDETEVKIAAITALCNSKNEKYIDELIDVYEKEVDWHVRVAVAKGFSKFEFEAVKNILLKMTKDKEWWVRYNAIKSIVAMGDEGLFTLIDLSLETEDKNISDLAYYFLNSNKDVYNIVKNIEV